jgi:hypothetical protein
MDHRRQRFIQLIRTSFLCPLLPLSLFPNETLSAFARLHAYGNVHDPFVEAQHAEILASIEAKQTSRSATYFELLTNTSLLHRVVLGCSLQYGL